MHLCTCVTEEGGDREGAGEDGDTKAGASPLELLSLDTHRREVAGAHGASHEMLHAETQSSIRQNMSKPVALLTLFRQTSRHLPSNLDPITTYNI